MFRMLSLLLLILFNTALLAASSSTDVTKLTTPTGNAFLLETGSTVFYFDAPIGKDIYTSRQCPVNYIPYVEINFRTVSSTNYGDQNIQEMGLCVVGVISRSPGYQVGYLSNLRTTKVQYVAPHSRYLSRDKNLYRRVVPFPEKLEIRDANASKPSAIRNIEWSVYCYPPGVATPVSIGRIGPNFIYQLSRCEGYPF